MLNDSNYFKYILTVQNTYGDVFNIPCGGKNEAAPAFMPSQSWVILSFVML